MGYKFDASETKDFSLIEEGMYEVNIEKAETKTLPSGKEKIAIQFRIRSDVDQKFQNRVVFEDIWKERGSDYYNRKRLNQLMGTQDFEDGKEFSNIYELLDELVGSFLQIKVTKVYDDYRGEEVNGIAYYRGSEHKPKSLDEDEKVDEESEVEVGEDDLPF